MVTVALLTKRLLALEVEDDNENFHNVRDSEIEAGQLGHNDEKALRGREVSTVKNLV